MKKILLILTVFASVKFLTAQITINRNDIIVSGQVLTMGNDTNTFSVQTGGANKTWNCSNLKAITQTTEKFNPPSWFPGYMNFPNANLASVSSEDDSSFSYYKINNSEFTSLGYYDIIGDTFDVYKQSYTLITFPSTYNTAYSGSILLESNSGYYGIDIDSAGPLPVIDSLRTNVSFDYKSNMEGWGSLTTPLGTFNALMQNIQVLFGFKLEMFMNNSWLSVSPGMADSLGFGSFPNDTFYSHQFWTNDASVGMPLLAYTFNNGETTTNDVNWMQTKPQANGIASVNKNSFASFYPNPCHNSFNVDFSNDITVELSICDLNGKTVRNETVVNGTKVDISNLDNGIYTLKYKDVANGSTIQVQKIIKY